MTRADALPGIFAARKGRCRLLDTGVQAAGWAAPMELLEIGCSIGDGAAHMAQKGFSVTAVDRDESCIFQAIERHPETTCRFLQADAVHLSFEDQSFDGLYSEAAFSVLEDKASAAGEYARVLRPESRVLLNDYLVKEERGIRRNIYIPCLKGAISIEEYRGIFEKAGFMMVYFREHYEEYLKIVMALCSAYKVSASELGACLMRQFDTDCSDPEVRDMGLSYCQMIFVKK